MNCRLSGMQVGNEGFTLVELIVVIVILGILSVSAIPKFVDLKSDARVATLKSMLGSIKATNNMVYAKAVFNGANTNYSQYSQSSTSTKWDPTCGANNCVEVDGVWVYFKLAYLDRNSVVFALDGDIAGRKTVVLGNGKRVPDRCGSGETNLTVANEGNCGTARRDSINYECSKYSADDVCTGYDFCQCREKGGNNKPDYEVFIPRGTPFKNSKCHLKYATAEEYTGRVPIYKLETSGC